MTFNFCIQMFPFNSISNNEAKMDTFKKVQSNTKKDFNTSPLTMFDVNGIGVY